MPVIKVIHREFAISLLGFIYMVTGEKRKLE